MSLEKNNLHNQQRRDHMVGSLSNALLDSKQAIKALWNEEYNSTTQKRLQNFIEKGIIKVLRDKQRGTHTISRAFSQQGIREGAITGFLFFNYFL